MAMIIGIDLGTTNSLVGFWRDGAPVLVPNALDEDGAVLVGRAARERLSTHPARSAAAFKRYMGTPRQFNLGTRTFHPEELSALVLRSLRLEALKRLKIHPRDQAENQALAARGKRLYEELLGRERDRLSHALVNFQAALDGQDPDVIAGSRRFLEGELARLDWNDFL